MSPGTAALDCLVVGAGIGGLSYAWRASLRGERVAVLEAAPTAGGVLATVSRSGYRVERAATSIPSSARALLELLASLPAPPALDAVEQARTQFLWTRAGLRAVPRGPQELLTSALMGPGGRLRMLAETLRAPRRVRRGETLEQFVQRRFGASVSRAFLRPFTRGVYGADPARLGAAEAFPQLVAMEQRRGSVLRALAHARGSGRRVLLVRGGTQRLVESLAAALGPALRTGTRAVSLTPGQGGTPVGLRVAGGETFTAREVVLAVPAAAQAQLLAPHLPQVAAVLRSVPYTPLAVIAVGFPRAGAPAVPTGFGFLRGAGVRARILGATFNSHLCADVAPPGHELLTVYAGGSEDPGFLELPEPAMRALVVRDLSRALGGRVAPSFMDVWRWPRAVPLFAPGHRGRMADAQQSCDALGVRLLGSHVTGIGLEACVAPRRRAEEWCA